jgi:hypothetical protein
MGGERIVTKKTRYVAVYQHNGKLLRDERTSAREYKYVAVVQWSDGRVSVGVKWSATEAGARNCLTRQQRDNGAKVIAVVAAEPQPDLTAASRQLGKLLNLRGD